MTAEHTTSAHPGPVLVVDDDAAVRHSLKFALELEGMDVRLYEGSDEVLSDADLPKIGCLVVDYYMPSINGVDLVGHLRARHVDLPAILMSAKVTQELRHCAARAGFRAVLEKPMQDGSLVDAIQGALLTA